MVKVPTELGDNASGLPEVAFALSLARLIEAAQQDPAQLRNSIYEAARLKLLEQLEGQDHRQARQLTRALETAIQGVEAFAQREDAARPVLNGPRKLEPTDRLIPPTAIPRVSDDRLAPARIEPSPRIEVYVPYRASAAKRFGLFLARCLLIVGIAGGVVAFALYSQRPAKTITTPPVDAAISAGTTEIAKSIPQAQQLPDALQTKLPTTFGVFALSAGELFELDALPARAPDIRVAMSAGISHRAKTIIPDGKVKFFVHRRDTAANAVDRADVRVVAQVRALNFSSPGQAAPSGESWVIRNISHPYRAAPVKDNADMVELRNEDAEFSLGAGRYVLIVKGVAYDFAVRGEVTDLKQCLERTQAANGTFYTDCRKL